jgi:hypothetical protein
MMSSLGVEGIGWVGENERVLVEVLKIMARWWVGRDIVVEMVGMN